MESRWRNKKSNQIVRHFSRQPTAITQDWCLRLHLYSVPNSFTASFSAHLSLERVGWRPLRSKWHIKSSRRSGFTILGWHVCVRILRYNSIISCKFPPQQLPRRLSFFHVYGRVCVCVVCGFLVNNRRHRQLSFFLSFFLSLSAAFFLPKRHKLDNLNVFFAATKSTRSFSLSLSFSLKEKEESKREFLPVLSQTEAKASFLPTAGRRQHQPQRRQRSYDAFLPFLSLCSSVYVFYRRVPSGLDWIISHFHPRHKMLKNC